MYTTLQPVDDPRLPADYTSTPRENGNARGVDGSCRRVSQVGKHQGIAPLPTHENIKVDHDTV